MPDLLKLAQAADVDPRTLLSFYSEERDRMKPRVRARIERALVEMKKSTKTSKTVA